MSYEFDYNIGEYITSPEQYVREVEKNPVELTHLRAHHIDVLVESIGSYIISQKMDPSLPTYNPEQWDISCKTVFMDKASIWLAGWANCYLSKIRYDEHPPKPIIEGFGIGRNYAEDLIGYEGAFILDWFQDILRIIYSIINTDSEMKVKLTMTPDAMCLACKSTASNQPGIHCMRSRSDNMPKDTDYVDTLNFIKTSQKLTVPHIANHLQMFEDGKLFALPMRILRSQEFLRIFSSCHNYLRYDRNKEEIDWNYSDIYFGGGS